MVANWLAFVVNIININDFFKSFSDILSRELILANWLALQVKIMNIFKYENRLANPSRLVRKLQ